MRNRGKWYSIILMTRLISVMTVLARSKGGIFGVSNRLARRVSTAATTSSSLSPLLLHHIRGGSSSSSASEHESKCIDENQRQFSTISHVNETQFVTLASPAPGSRMCCISFSKMRQTVLVFGPWITFLFYFSLALYFSFSSRFTSS